MAGKFMKGAFVQFMETLLVPLPNVIVFQFNPETIIHTWSPQGVTAAAGAGAATTTTKPGDPMAVSGPPGESFSFTIQLDAKDQITEGGPVSGAIAEATGVYSRLAALEMLMFPTGDAGGGSLLASVSISAGGLSASAGGSAEAKATPKQVPTVLFIWGPGRIVPVRITGMTVTEKLYDGLLSPTYAEVQLQLRALSPEELEHVGGPLGDLAKFAAKYMTVTRQALAVANLANAAESIVGMLPV